MEEAIEFAKTALRRWNDFSGRSRRKEYWYFVLAVSLCNLTLGIIEEIFDLSGALAGTFSLLMLIPLLAVGIRRLHDTGRSGWLMFLGIVPLLGLVLLYFFVQDSQSGRNQYGPNPKDAIVPNLPAGDGASAADPRRFDDV